MHTTKMRFKLIKSKCIPKKKKRYVKKSYKEMYIKVISSKDDDNSNNNNSNTNDNNNNNHVCHSKKYKPLLLSLSI